MRRSGTDPRITGTHENYPLRLIELSTKRSSVAMGATRVSLRFEQIQAKTTKTAAETETRRPGTDRGGQADESFAGFAGEPATIKTPKLKVAFEEANVWLPPCCGLYYIAQPGSDEQHQREQKPSTAVQSSEKGKKQNDTCRARKHHQTRPVETKNSIPFEIRHSR